MNKKILGIDYGEAKIGLAISADSLALPLEIIANSEDAQEKIKKIVKSEKVDLLVVGLPLGKMGEETAGSQKIKKFAGKLAVYLGLEVVLFDERLTTAQVKALRVGGEDDAHAAALILQAYIDSISGNIL